MKAHLKSCSKTSNHNFSNVCECINLFECARMQNRSTRAWT